MLTADHLRAFTEDPFLMARIAATDAIGFTLTGLATAPITKSGARPGDLLVLTKALGSGTILAAEMQRAAPGAVVAGCLAAMIRPLGPDAALLVPHAHAMTDVTGFGLAGHLLEMLTASGCAAELDSTAIPLLPGAAALAAAGHRSSLYPQNRLANLQTTLPAGPESAATTLLFVFQTAGGLLAALPEAAAMTFLPRLQDIAPDPRVIGRITAGAPWITLLQAYLSVKISPPEASTAGMGAFGGDI